jgi:hypothetical protein
VPLHDDEPLEDLLAQSRYHAQQFNIWLDQLRAGDPAFAEASPLYPDDMGEWQAAVYLLAGCDQVWLPLAQNVLTEVSIAPVYQRARAPSPRLVLKRRRGRAMGGALLGRRPLGREIPPRLRDVLLPALDHRLPPLQADHAGDPQRHRGRTMTLTLPGADIRGYYAALGIPLPGWAPIEASVRCFADPDAHRRGDRDPSCSVNLAHGAWHCHAGGAFDAATARGYSDLGAIDLMVAYRLTEHRPYRRPSANAGPRSGSISARPAKPPRTLLRPTTDDIDHWQAALASDADLIARLARDRGWLYAAMLELELGVDRGRITIPVRDDERRLIGMLRYQPWPQPREPKMLATAGSRRALLPHPAAEPSTHVLLVEGEPDMIGARSRGLPAIAVPGVDGWRRAWAQLFAGRDVTVIMDCDEQGRAAAAAIESDLSQLGVVRVLDLAPDRNDGYDLTDWLLQRKQSQVASAVGEAITSTGDTRYGRL